MSMRVARMSLFINSIGTASLKYIRTGERVKCGSSICICGYDDFLVQELMLVISCRGASNEVRVLLCCFLCIGEILSSCHLFHY